MLLNKHNKYDGKGKEKIVSAATQEARKTVLFASLKQLHKNQFKIQSVYSFKEKHAIFLIREWESSNLSASTIQTRASVLRCFSAWINKPGMIKPVSEYLENPASGVRCYVAKNDKSWTAQGIDAELAISEIEKYDFTTAMHLRLCLTFGLRRKEAIMLKPHRADKGLYLVVTDGTKGGRDRIVPVDTDRKREVINQAKAMARSINNSVSNERRTLKQELSHYSYVLNSRGFNRTELQVTGHGLRHQYLNDRYQEIAGHPTPVRGGSESNTYEEEIARLTTSEEAGHSRKSITTAYYGSQRMAKKNKTPKLPPDPASD